MDERYLMMELTQKYISCVKADTASLPVRVTYERVLYVKVDTASLPVKVTCEKERGFNG
jgi:hypothetical protein